MRRTFLMLTVLLLLLSLTAAQKTSVKRISVTSQAVVNGKPYVLDLRRAGTIYQVEADVDLSRVQVRTPGGLVELADLAKQAERSGKLSIGHTSDVLSKDLKMAAAREIGYSCDETFCRCAGFHDCFLMGKDGVCKGITVCGDTGCTCWRGFSRNVSRGSRLSQ